MKVFLSWSGERSRSIAQALRDWLPLCIQSLDPWMSAADIDKGARWFDEIEAALASADGRGVFCVTPENLASPWLNFEAGVVASRGGKARVCSLVIGLNQGDVPPPLGLFQLTPATREDILQLLKSLNKDCLKPLSDKVLERAFELNWPELEQAIAAALRLEARPAPRARPAEETLEEVLGIARRIEQSVGSQESNLRRLARAMPGRGIPSPEPLQTAIESFLTSKGRKLDLNKSDRHLLNEAFVAARKTERPSDEPGDDKPPASPGIPYPNF